MLIKNGQDLKYKHVNNHKSLMKILKQKIHSRLKRFQSSFKKGVINKRRDGKKKKRIKTFRFENIHQYSLGFCLFV